MKQSEIQHAKTLSKSLASMGYGSKPIAKKPIKQAVKSPFAYSYKTLEKPEDDRTLLARQAASHASSAAKQAADLAQVVEQALSEVHARLSSTEALSRVASSTSTEAVNRIEKAISSIQKNEPFNLEDIKAQILSQIEVPKAPESLVVNEAMVREIVKIMHTLPEADKLEVSKGIRNASSFIFNKTKYQTSELMHGGGSSTGGASSAVLDLSSQCNGTNKVFTINAFTTILSLIGSDSPIIYRPLIDFTATGVTLTLSAGVNAPSNGATLILNYVPA